MFNTTFTNLLNDTNHYIISGVLILFVLFGLMLMSKVEKARLGNIISGLAILLGVIVSLIKYDIISVWAIYIFIGVGAIIGIILAYKIKMIDMPQLIALLNSFGGLASSIVGGYALFSIGGDGSYFSLITGMLALIIGIITFVGSIIAVLKLHKLITQKRVVVKFHNTWTILALVLVVVTIITQFIFTYNMYITLVILSVLSIYLGLALTLPVGGADMPIAISLLNSLSGVAGAISGLAINNLLLVAIGGIVGASGLLLTQAMGKAMNRKISSILFLKEGTTSTIGKSLTTEKTLKESQVDHLKVLKDAKQVIIVPGYGMAVAQAQHHIKEITTLLTKKGKTVKFAIHPVAGRMPGHMNVLLAEAHISYNLLFDADNINDDFKDTDLVLVVGANDVINPAARTEKGTALYGMPILNVDQAKNIFIFNYDLNPGYAGVDNPLYDDVTHVKLFLGNAFDTLKDFIASIKEI